MTASSIGLLTKIISLAGDLSGVVDLKKILLMKGDEGTFFQVQQARNRLQHY